MVLKMDAGRSGPRLTPLSLANASGAESKNDDAAGGNVKVMMLRLMVVGLGHSGGDGRNNDNGADVGYLLRSEVMAILLWFGSDDICKVCLRKWTLESDFGDSIPLLSL